MNTLQMLDRILDPVAATFTPEVARRLIAIEPDPLFQTRLDELATKSNFGELSDDEREEYKGYVDIIELISLLQAKARQLLESHPSNG